MGIEVERAEYDKRWSNAEHYGSGHPGYTRHFLDFMRRNVEARPKDQRVALDVGCGDGFFTNHLTQLGCTATGIDLSPVGLQHARNRTPGATFLPHDLTQPFPFADNSFDLVWCSEVLEHLFAPLGVVQQVQRVLKPGGVFLATTPAHGMLKNVAIALFAFEKHYDPEYPHIRFFTNKSLAGLITKAGLRVESVSNCGSGLGLRDVLFPTNILIAARK